MSKYSNIFFKSIAASFFAAMLFSCEGRINEVRQMDQEHFGPQTEEKIVNLVYTDSGKVAFTLKSPQMLDFSQLKFPYREFPEGISVEFFDDHNKKNTVEADYAIMYNNTNLVDLQGHVKIVTSDSTILIAQQLYWDRKREWVFTDYDFTIKMNNGTVNNGEGFDANEKFDNFIARSNTGTHFIEEENE